MIDADCVKPEGRPSQRVASRRPPDEVVEVIKNIPVTVPYQTYGANLFGSSTAACFSFLVLLSFSSLLFLFLFLSIFFIFNFFFFFILFVVLPVLLVEIDSPIVERETSGRDRGTRSDGVDFILASCCGFLPFVIACLFLLKRHYFFPAPACPPEGRFLALSITFLRFCCCLEHSAFATIDDYHLSHIDKCPAGSGFYLVAMVTENGNFRYSPRMADYDIPSRRRIPQPLRLDPLRIHPPPTPPSRPATSHSQNVRAQSPRLHAGAPRGRGNYGYWIPPEEQMSPCPSPQYHPEYYYDFDAPKPANRAPTFPAVPHDPSPVWRQVDSESDRQSRRKMPPGRPGLRISMSSSRLNHQKRAKGHHSRECRPNNEHTSTSQALGPPRVTPNGSLDAYGKDDALRSSVNSAMTSRSSIEHASGTERSSVLTKSSSITDLSPDTPDEPEKDEGMSVEDAISMYLDGFSDVTEEPSSPELHPEDKLHPTSSLRSPTQLTGDGGQADDERSLDINPVKNLAPVPTLPDLHVLGQNLPSQEVQDDRSPTHEPPPDPASHELVHNHQTLHHETVDRIDTQEKKVVIPGAVPPPLIPGTESRDCYGFRKATNHVPLDRYNVWSRPYSNYAANRKTKWIELLRENGLETRDPTRFPPKSTRVKRFVRKGIPSEYRGAAWFWYAGGFDLMNRNPGLYDDLVQRAMASPTNDDKEHIERDLHRTFPDNIHFKPDSEQPGNPGAGSGSSNLGQDSVVVETEMIQSLRRVLYAYALHNPKVGYTQSLNFITGMLLLFLPEEKAFWLLHIITSIYLPGTHEISLEGANIDLWILMVLLKESLPNVYSKIADTSPASGKARVPALTVHSRLPDITLGLTNWLMSIFIGTLPLETTLRVWDVFFYEGSKTFFRVSLAIFKACERDILNISDPMEVFQVVQTIPKKLLDANMLLEDCFVRRHRVGQGRIDELRASRRAAVRQDKIRRSAALTKGQLQAATDEWATTTPRARTPIPGLERSIADSWRHMRRHHHAVR